jgi:hypothetical protein
MADEISFADYDTPSYCTPAILLYGRPVPPNKFPQNDVYRDGGDGPLDALPDPLLGFRGPLKVELFEN